MRRWWTSWWVAPSVFLVSVGIGVLFQQGLTELRLRAFDSRLQQEAQFRAVRLREQFEVRLTLVEVLLTELQSGRLARGASFAERARQLHERFPGIQALNLVDDQGVIVQVVPAATNQAALGKNVQSNPIARSAFALARTTGRPHLTRPLTLFQGGKGFAGYFPVEGKENTNVNAVFRIADVVGTIVDEGLLQSHQVVLECDGEEVLRNALDDTLHTRAKAATFRVRDQEWTLRLRPSTAQVQQAVQTTLLLPLVLLVGVLMGLLSALIVRGLRRQAALEERLQQARQMEALSTLAGGMAHDFNNLLTALTTILQLNRKERPDDDTWREDVETMLEACAQGTRLTAQMMALSMRKETTSEPFIADEAIKVAMNLLDKSLPSSVKLNTDLQAPRAWLFGQAGGLQQAVLNLSLNACDAMPNGGRLFVSTALTADRKTFELVIEDEGEGISDDDLKKIFDPFFSTKAPGKGTGLGLSMVFHVVKAFGGNIDVASEVSVGTKMRITLPTVPAPVVSDEEEQMPPDRLTNVVVLIVDDDETIRRTLQRRFESEGAKVVTASGGHEALRYAGPFDVLLTDMRMANGGGAMLVRTLWERRPKLPVVVMSGFSDDEIPTSEEASVRFVSKPFQLDTIVSAVGAVLKPRK